MSNKLKDEFDWVSSLPVYQHIYNTTVHLALGIAKLYNYNVSSAAEKGGVWVRD